MSLPSDRTGPVSAIASAFRAAGLPVFSIVGRSALDGLAAAAGEAEAARYGLHDSAGAVVAAFPYDPRPVPGAADDPGFLSVGTFAAWNRYAALARLLRFAGGSLAASSGLRARGFRTLVNSRIPEKRLGELAGLGFIGRSSLLVTAAYGPACILGALLLHPGYPLEGLSDATAGDMRGGPEPGPGCGSCRACADACPTAAIGQGEGDQAIDTERCVQYWATAPGEVPGDVLAAWGCRLYGCDDCVAACPRSSGAWTPGPGGTAPSVLADSLVLPQERRPGRSVPRAAIEAATDGELRAFFAGTALGMSWIRPDLLRRNAGFFSRCPGAHGLV